MTTGADSGLPVTANRDNFMRLSGQPLRDYAHRLGVARSEAAKLDDTKLKEQCRYLIGQQYGRD
jgi:hypothetical protein